MSCSHSDCAFSGTPMAQQFTKPDARLDNNIAKTGAEIAGAMNANGCVSGAARSSISAMSSVLSKGSCDPTM
ncbi:hypothetical protein G6F40_016197 [Rhizopus arrhizus]|nr:hypothetical protein G6F40_016197 [Rhizopus arrhizus]